MRSIFYLLALLLLSPLIVLAETNPRELVAAAIDYWRGQSSYFEAQMRVHRPDWERAMTLKGWTSGRKKTLVRFTKPAKDAGNASLTTEDGTWSYNPKINKVIRIPPSMMSQSWMGSDFSYDDLSKDDQIIDEYVHKLVSEEQHQGKKVWVIQATPKENAAIVWGMEQLKIREDNIIIEHKFFDQDKKLVKTLSAIEVGMLGGRMYAIRIKMENAENLGEWTEVYHSEAKFGESFPESIFSQANLKSEART